MVDVNEADLISVLFDFVEAVIRSVNACIRGQDPDLQEAYMAADALDDRLEDIINK